MALHELFQQEARAIDLMRGAGIEYVGLITPRGNVGGIVNVHFFLPSLFPFFQSSLPPGGYLIFESVPGCGGNYLELPARGYVRSLLASGFDFEIYKERKVGPPDHDEVTTLTVAKRRKRAGISPAACAGAFSPNKES